jgi:putative transposase
LKGEYTIEELCKYLNVSVSGYYKYKKTAVIQKDVELSQRILEIYNKYNGIYGYRQIHMELTEGDGLKVNHKKVFRIYHELGLLAKIRKKKFRNLNQYKQTEPERIMPNLLERDFSANESDTKWVTDITEFTLFDKKLYVSAVMDLYNKEIIGYQIGNLPDKLFVMKTIKMALDKRKDADGVILHSDRGSQYTSRVLQDTLESFGIRLSMSRAGNPYDNACIESFFSHFKTEAIYPYDVQTLEELEQRIVEYINFYNNERRQKKLGKLSPINFRLQNAA